LDRELGDPEVLLLLAEIVDIRDVLLEVGGVGTAIPMEGEDVDVAVSASSEEGREPLETLAGLDTVGDGGGDESGFARKGVHVGDPVFGCVAESHVGLGGEIRLVESQQGGAPAADSCLCLCMPFTKAIGTPKHGDVFQRTSVTALVHTPVVNPRDHRAGERREEGGVGVGDTTLAAAAVGRCGARGCRTGARDGSR